MKVRNFAKPNITVVLQKWPICYSQTVNLTIVCSPLSAEGRGGELNLLPNFQKEWAGADTISNFRGVTFFRGVVTFK